MNNQIKKIIIDSALFEEDEEYKSGLFYLHKNNFDATKDLEFIVHAISEEYVRAVQLWQESSDETNNAEYIRGYQEACKDILVEIKNRF
jgi:hypothetical protein